MAGSAGMGGGTFSATGYVNYISHYFHELGTSSNSVLEACGCPDYSTYLPPYATADLSFGNNTGLIPANEYMRNINFQVVIKNVLDRHAFFVYNTRYTGAFDHLQGVDPIGRCISLGVTKNW